MKTDFSTRKIKFLYPIKTMNTRILIILTTLALLTSSLVIVVTGATKTSGDEIVEENSSGDGDDEFPYDGGPTRNIKVGHGNLKLMPKHHEAEIFQKHSKKEERKQQKLGKEEESSGFRENDDDREDQNNGEDDDEDNERENPPFPPRSDAFWKVEEQKPKGMKPSIDEKVAENPEKDEKLSDPRPNIILILTDDQDIELGSMDYMPETLKIFREGGVEFRHGYVTTPMCCPSRSSMLTGLYVHNHQVYTNNDNCSSVLWRERFEKKTFASYLWAEGYYTSYIGKYLNKYDGSHIPHGWDEWNTLLMNSRFYNYTLNRNGKRFRYGNKYEKDYYPDSIANDTINFLNRMSSSSTDVPNFEQSSTEVPVLGPILKKLPSQPFLLVVSFPSPHGPEDSAPQYSQMFLNDTPHHTPSYNYAPNLDKQWILRTTPRMTPVLKEFTNLLMTKRLQTLQTVDLAVKNIFDTLKRHKLIDNTYVFYTSDHGYHVGQFGLIKGKSMPYEFDIRVPFFLTTPKNMVAGRTVITEPVLNIDLAPTFLDLAGVTVPGDMDGRSMVPLIRKYSQRLELDSEQDTQPFQWTEMFLIESSGRRDIGPDGSSLSTTKKPTFTISSVVSTKNKSIEIDWPMIGNETVEMTKFCLAHPHPCQPGQKKYCQIRSREKTRIRFRKCRTSSDFLPLDEEMSDGVSTNLTISTTTNYNKCKCRSRRSADEDLIEFDWESERQKIDAEIEALKLRIESLRERRREMRRRWTSKAYTTKLEKSRVVVTEPKKKNQIQVTIIHPPNVDVIPKITGSFTDTSIRNIVLQLQEQSTQATSASGVTTAPADTGSEKISTIDDSGHHHHSRANRNNQENDAAQRSIINDKRLHPHLNHHSDEDDNTRLEEDFEIEEQNNKPKNGRNHHPGSNRSNSGTLLLLEENKTLKPGSVTNNDDGSLEEMIDEEEERVHKRLGKGRKVNNLGSSTRKIKYNRKNDVRDTVDEDNDSDTQINDHNCDCSNNPGWSTQREKEERKRKKFMSKLRKKQRFLKRIDDPRERHEAETCGTEDKMNCFWHDKDHWRTAPLWTSESFCFCMNANNNTYSCLRAINSTHNYIYCQFITGFKMYFDLRHDPYELRNIIGNLRPREEAWISAQLLRLKSCQGREECGSQKVQSVVKKETLSPSIWEKIFGRWRRKKKNRNGGTRKMVKEI